MVLYLPSAKEVQQARGSLVENLFGKRNISKRFTNDTIQFHVKVAFCCYNESE